MHGKEYYFSSEKKTQEAAQAFCKSKGGKLFEPKSAQVNDDVANLAKERGLVSAWIGIHDKSVAGQFVYESDGKPYVWNNWGPGEPNDRGHEENCAYVSLGGQNKWKDCECDDDWECDAQIVCERDILKGNKVVQTIFQTNPLLEFRYSLPIMAKLAKILKICFSPYRNCDKF